MKKIHVIKALRDFQNATDAYNNAQSIYDAAMASFCDAMDSIGIDWQSIPMAEVPNYLRGQKAYVEGLLGEPLRTGEPISGATVGQLQVEPNKNDKRNYALGLNVWYENNK